MNHHRAGTVGRDAAQVLQHLVKFCNLVLWDIFRAWRQEFSP